MKMMLASLAVSAALCASALFTAKQLAARTFTPREWSATAGRQDCWWFADGAHGRWLTVSYNGDRFTAHGFDAASTTVTSEFAPRLRRLADGRWELSFRGDRNEGINAP